MPHRSAPLSFEGRLRLVQRCRHRPIALVPAETGISRACASKWVNRWRRHGDLGLHDRSSTPHHSPSATPADVIAQIECWRREHKWSAGRITHELAETGVAINRRTVTRHLSRLGLGRRRFLDPCGDSNRVPGRIVARWPVHMVHLDVKKVGRITAGGGWRVHGRGSDQARSVHRAKAKTKARGGAAGARAGYVYLHSAVDGFSRLANTESLADEKGRHRGGVLGPGQGLVRRARHRPPAPRRHRQRRLLTLRRLRPDRRRPDPQPQDQAVHPAPQRQGRALPADLGRGSALRPRLQLRERPLSRDRRMEHPLQLPSPAQRRGRVDPPHLGSPWASPPSDPHTPSGPKHSGVATLGSSWTDGAKTTVGTGRS